MDVSTDDNCRLWTAETGRGEPLIMCHGGPGLWDMSGSLAARLAERLTVIRWDQRGCGRSERRGPYSVARCVADLDAIFGQRTKAALFNQDCYTQIWAELQRTWHEDELMGQCRALEVPVLIIDGERDLRPRWAVDSLERALPRVTRVILPDAGHIPWLEEPEEFTRPLLAFLEQAIHP
jgi:proline iminopeptidase